MDHKNIRQKAALLLCMTGALLMLMSADEKQKKNAGPEPGEALRIPEREEEGSSEETRQLPGEDAVIRVLLLAEDGGLVPGAV